MIAPAIPPRSLDRADIARFLDHAQQSRVAPGVAADRAGVFIGEIAACRARHDPSADSPDGLRQTLRDLRGLLQQMEREPLGGLAPDAGELSELRHELLDGGHGSRRAYSGSWNGKGRPDASFRTSA